MKKFLLKFSLSLLVFLIVIEIVSFFLIQSNVIYNRNYIYPGSEIYRSITKSKKKSNAKILLLGDSVGNQLFPSEKSNDTINSLTSNQAISIVGQYILLQNYLETGNRPTKVVLLYSPFSLKNNLDQKFTFHYFIKPFYKKEYIHFFSELAIQQIDKIPFYKYSQGRVGFCVRLPNKLF